MEFAGLFSPENMTRARQNEEDQKKALMTLLPTPAAVPAPVPEPVPLPVEAPLAAPQPLIVETVDTTTTNATQGSKPTANEASLVAEQNKLFAAQQAQAEKAAEAGRNKAIEEAAKADERLKLTADKQVKTDAIVQDGEKTLADRLAESDRVYQSLKERADIKDYWEKQSTGDKVMAGLAIALGGFGSALTGDKSNRALDIINRAVEQDFAMQKANFENQKGLLGEARAQTQDARQGIQDQVNMLNLSKAAAYDTLADKYAGMAAKRGIPEAEAAKDAVLLDLRAKQNAARMAYEQGLRQSVTTQTQRKVDQTAITPAELAGKASEAVSKFQSEIQGNTDFSGWKKKKASLESFSSMKEAGASGAALVDFIAGGLQQGSFGPEMVNLLSKRNLLDKAGNIIRENVVGGFDPALMGAIENGLKSQEAKTRKQAAAPIARSRLEAKRLGLAEDYFTGATQKTIVKKQFNSGLNKTKLVFSDGTEEIVDGQQ